MSTSERRIIASLILLTGVTVLSIASTSGQLEFVLELMRTVFAPAVAGLP